MLKPGSLIILNKPFWHMGQDLGSRLGMVISTESYIEVEVLDYDSNPVKCFVNEVQEIEEEVQEPEFDDPFWFNLDLD